MKGSKVSRRHFLKHGTSSVAATIAATALGRMGVNPREASRRNADTPASRGGEAWRR